MPSTGGARVDGVVAVSGGWVSGEDVGDVWRFTGVPYARPPVGPLRWRAPEDPEPWSGVRSARAPGPIAPQTPPIAGAAIPGDPVEQSEDCLSLNVWAPIARAAPRAVLFWIHGGGFTGGTGASMLYDGCALARSGDVVVVTCNYRLGALGFLAHPVLAAGSGSAVGGNFGLMDQVAALRWVHRHIAELGGDPGNVTVFGESAGAMSIAALLSAPAARGLFRRAVVQSGPPYVHTAEQAHRVAGDLLEVLGISQCTRERLASVPAADLVAAVASLQNRTPQPGELPLPFLPVIDGTFLPQDPLDAVSTGCAAGVDVLTGTNRDELAFFGLASPSLMSMDRDGLTAWLARSAPYCDPEAVRRTYQDALERQGRAATVRDIWVAAGSDLVFRAPTWTLATTQVRHHPGAWVYLFTYETPILGGILGSCHALEVPFVFGTHDRPGIASFVGQGPEVDGLSARMQRAWTTFAWTGRPASEATGPWQEWDPESQPVMVFGPGGTAGQVLGPGAEELRLWDPAFRGDSSSDADDLPAQPNASIGGA